MSAACQRCPPSSCAKRVAATPHKSALYYSGLMFVLSVLSVAVCVAATSKKKDASYLSSTVGGSGGVYTLYTVTGCSECTVNLSQRWCPSTMRCYPASNCTCDGPVACIDLRACFYGSRPRCRECVDSGGVYCAGGVSALTPRGTEGSQEVRCYPPDGHLLSRGAATDETATHSTLAISNLEAPPSLLTCAASTCEGGQCIQRAADCPAEVSDPLTRSYEVISLMVVLVLTCLVIRNIYRLVV